MCTQQLDDGYPLSPLDLREMIMENINIMLEMSGAAPLALFRHQDNPSSMKLGALHLSKYTTISSRPRVPGGSVGFAPLWSAESGSLKIDLCVFFFCYSSNTRREMPQRFHIAPFCCCCCCCCYCFVWSLTLPNWKSPPRHYYCAPHQSSNPHRLQTHATNCERQCTA